jgi:ketosteroid isomerase-like protein
MARAFLIATACLVAEAVLAAQSPDQEVIRAVEEGNDAARAHDTVRYARFLADDVVWINARGGLTSKQERLKAIINPPNPRTLNETELVHVYGDAAVLVAVATRADGSKRRLVRTLVKRDGRWQLVLHTEFDVR